MSCRQGEIFYSEATKLFPSPLPILPTELIHHILAFLSSSHESRTLLTTSLVNHTFLLLSRQLLFGNKLSLSQNHIHAFLELCEHPLSTLPRGLARTEELHVYHDPDACMSEELTEQEKLERYLAFDELFSWRKPKPKSTSMSKSKLGTANTKAGTDANSSPSPPSEPEPDSEYSLTLPTLFPTLQSLSISWMGWWVLSESSKQTLYYGFRDVKQLRLLNVQFTSQKRFRDFVMSFPRLETLYLDGVKVDGSGRGDPVPECVTKVESRSRSVSTVGGGDAHTLVENENPVPLANLQCIHLKNIHISSSQIIESLASSVQSNSLRALKCHFTSLRAVYASGALPGLKKVLVDAGESLQELEFVVDGSAGAGWDGAWTGDEERADPSRVFFPYISLSTNSRIRRITFRVDANVGYIGSFLEHIASASSCSSSASASPRPTPTLTHLEITYPGSYPQKSKPKPKVESKTNFSLSREVLELDLNLDKLLGTHAYFSALEEVRLRFGFGQPRSAGRLGGGIWDDDDEEEDGDSGDDDDSVDVVLDNLSVSASTSTKDAWNGDGYSHDYGKDPSKDGGR